MRKSIYFIRHAESEYNRIYSETGVELPGYRNCGLTMDGIDQVKQLSTQLDGIKFDAVVVSPMKRALDTLKHIGYLTNHHRVIVNPECREFKQAECDLFENEDLCFETIEQLSSRIDKFKQWLNTELADALIIAVICHGDFIYHACEPNKNSAESEYWLDNAAYTVIDW